MAEAKEWLTDSLVKALGWEPAEAGGLVDAIAAATPAERNGIVEGFLGDNKKARGLVDTFVQRTQQARRSQVASVSDPKGREQRQGERQAGSVIVRHVGRSQKDKATAATTTGSGVPPPQLREVCNCLGCGKIYFPAMDTADTRAFMATRVGSQAEPRGSCTFCGCEVSLAKGVMSPFRPPARGSRAGAGPSSTGDALEGSQEAEETASQFKDRMIEYDRNSKRRTTVVDDQNDYFEIDSNRWLKPEEREQLKRQEREMREAEEARRKTVTVSFDILGRKVVMAEDREPTQQAIQFAQASLAAAEATQAERPQGGGTAAREAKSSAARIRHNAALKTPRPLFLQTAPETVQERQKRRGFPAAQEATESCTPQNVPGGWGVERASGTAGTGMSVEAAKARRQRDASSKEVAPPTTGAEAKGKPRGKGAQSQEQRPAVQKPSKQTKRPQLNRVQHDDPFELSEFAALDDLRLEE